jgi:predicted transglutaminase-like cysteine proteinase
LAAIPLHAEEGSTAANKFTLFNTLEIRGSLKAFALWRNLVASAQQQLLEFDNCRRTQQLCDPQATSWRTLYEAVADLPQREQLLGVNRYFNRWPYRLDIEAHNRSDYWETPREFLRLSGDCEDYSITKYFALRQLGFPAAILRIVVLRDSIRNLGHAVLVVKLDGTLYVLDNMTDLVLPQERYSHYQPQYSLNENYRWAHIRKTP